MKSQVMPLLIEQARKRRDEQSARVQAASQGVQQALGTLRQLQDFRADYLRRSPASAGQSMHVERLQDFQRFLARLEEAIGQQQQELSRRQQQLADAQAFLAEDQRRLMAFETLATRQADELERLARRREQRESDEFAARAQRMPPY